MGMFDWVRTRCPKDGCPGSLETQSKSGPCLLNDYELETAPDEVIEGVIGDRMYCRVCGTGRTVRKREPRTIQVFLD
jgi:hypothetical protein